MENYKLFHSDIEISPITLGTWVFGGSNWSGAKEDDCIAVVGAAIDAGINCIDTAPIYSVGISEEIVGKAIKGKREKLVIATKCGLLSDGKGGFGINLTPESIREEIELSLKRLGCDYIDIYQCHWPDKNVAIEKTMETLVQLKEEGKIKCIGVSNHTVDLFKRALTVTEITTSQDQYSLLDRGIEQALLPCLKENNIGLLAYGPLAGGILTGKYSQPKKFGKSDARSFFYKFYEGKSFEQTQLLLEQLKEIGKPLNQIAINWIRQQEGVASVIVGARHAQQMQDNAKALEWSLTEDQLNTIDEILNVKAHG